MVFVLTFKSSPDRNGNKKCFLPKLRDESIFYCIGEQENGWQECPILYAPKNYIISIASP